MLHLIKKNSLSKVRIWIYNGKTNIWDVFNIPYNSFSINGPHLLKNLENNWASQASIAYRIKPYQMSVTVSNGVESDKIIRTSSLNW